MRTTKELREVTVTVSTEYVLRIPDEIADETAREALLDELAMYEGDSELVDVEDFEGETHEVELERCATWLCLSGDEPASHRDIREVRWDLETLNREINRIRESDWAGWRRKLVAEREAIRAELLAHPEL